jgi:hypothetical protein
MMRKRLFGFINSHDGVQGLPALPKKLKIFINVKTFTNFSCGRAQGSLNISACVAILRPNFVKSERGYDI